MLVEQPEVVIGVVEHDLDVRIGQDSAEGGQVPAASGSTTAVSWPRGDLEQIDPVVVAVEARRLGVHGE